MLPFAAWLADRERSAVCSPMAFPLNGLMLQSTNSVDLAAAVFPPVASDDFLSGGGDMGELIRAADWANTPLGATHTWPQSLRTALSIMLESRFAMVVAWGPEFRFFYNNGYRPIL